MVVRKTERRNGLYELMGDTNITGNGYACIVMANKPNLAASKDKTNLWHSRLGQMSGK